MPNLWKSRGKSQDRALSLGTKGGYRMAIIKPHFWINVPNGSTLHAKAKGTNNNFNIDMGVDSSAKNDDSVINHAKIVAGTTLALRSPRHYAITIRTNFAGSGAPTVTFRAFIEKPDGSQHGDAYEFEVKDPKKAPYRALIGIVTEGGGSQ